jgi:F0F1-type ATP synthase epsilon subunit
MLVDVIDFTSKWTNAIVTKVEKEMVKVVVDGDLEIELSKVDIIAPFESKAGECSNDKLQKLKDNMNENKHEEKHENIITKKVTKSKRHHNIPTPPVVEEPVIPEVK